MKGLLFRKGIVPKLLLFPSVAALMNKGESLVSKRGAAGGSKLSCGKALRDGTPDKSHHACWPSTAAIVFLSLGDRRPDVLLALVFATHI